MNDFTERSDPSALPERPLVSVYMATYNHESYIAQAIDGVLVQSTEFPIELLVAEDASTDRTMDIVLGYQQRHPDVIRVITGATNVGARENFKRAAPLFRGNFIAFCEGDDYWCDPTKLSHQVDLLSARREISLACHAVRIADESIAEPAAALTHRPTGRSRLVSDAELILGDGALIPTCSILVRADILGNRPKWWDDAPIGDYPLVLRAAQIGRVACINKVMGVYRINVPGSWSNRQHRHTIERGHHADAIRSMLLGYLHEGGGRFQKQADAVISKYFFDAIVRTQGEASAKQSLFRRSIAELTLADRVIARLSLALGQNLGWLRTLVKRVSSSVRRLFNDLVQPDLHVNGH